jgi:predicted transcriptional regulator
MRSLREQYSLLDKPLSHLCESAAKVNVKNCMYTPTEGEYVEESDSLDQAVHQLVMGHHQSLLVTRDKEIVGVLRLTDVFKAICEGMKECEL